VLTGPTEAISSPLAIIYENEKIREVLEDRNRAKNAPRKPKMKPVLKDRLKDCGAVSPTLNFKS